VAAWPQVLQASLVSTVVLITNANYSCGLRYPACHAKPHVWKPVKIVAANAPCAVRDFLNRAKRFAGSFLTAWSSPGNGMRAATTNTQAHTHANGWVGTRGVLRFAANPAPTAGEGSRSFT
jgi:hypothetical protein